MPSTRGRQMRFGRILLGLVATIVVACIVFLVWAWRSEIAAIDPPSRTEFDPALVKRGAELAAIGNCQVCHTNPGAQAYAGGRPLETPFGTIYSTNITPDPDTGVGRWSETAFRRAMREGVDRYGRHLYPAFPYEHFTKMTDEDVRALYAFVMTRDPVQAEARPNRLPFPLNVRLSLAGWKLLFFRPGAGDIDAAQASEWSHGRYLTEAVAHCGACHRPRNRLGAESSETTFSGGTAENWDAPSLDARASAPMSAAELAAFLRADRAVSYRAAGGPMAPVTDNLSRVSDRDVKAIAVYIASLSGGAAAQASQSSASTQGNAPTGSQHTDGDAPPGAGAATYAGACAGCHDNPRQIGFARGLDLKLSSAVHANRPRNFVQFLLTGVQPPEGRPGAFMPSFAGALTDEQLSALATYVRGRFSKNPPWQDIGGEIARVKRGES
jgi:mono/diheme cytochrome c family protein